MVQGEKLVIRKLVVAGIVSAEKSYLDCLNVMKEVSCLLVECNYVHVYMYMYSVLVYKFICYVYTCTVPRIIWNWLLNFLRILHTLLHSIDLCMCIARYIHVHVAKVVTEEEKKGRKPRPNKLCP